MVESVRKSKHDYRKRKAIDFPCAAFVWLFLVKLSVGPALADSASTISQPGFMGKTSTDIRPVTISTKNYVLKIPRNFLETAAFSSDKIFFRVVMRLPGFHGVEPRSAAMFSSLTSRAGWWSAAPTNVVWAYSSFISSAREHWIDPVLAAAKTQNIKNNEYGLTKVSGPLLVGEYYVFLAKPSEDPLVIKCYTVIKATCHVQIDLSPGLVVEYEYSRENLPQWRYIDKGVKRLLMSFVEK